MSRLIKKPLAVPKDVAVTVDGQAVTVRGKLGELTKTFPPEIRIAFADGVLRVALPDAKEGETIDRKELRRCSALAGLTYRMIAGMIEGVSKGFQKVLMLEGVGYRASTEGSNLVLKVGFSSECRIPVPAGIKIGVDKNQTIITVDGADKAKVGEFASYVRRQRRVEPYKGKGIRYRDEHVRRKEGKAAAK